MRSARKPVALKDADSARSSTRRRLVDKKNEITLGLNPERQDLAGATLVSLDRDKYVLWRDLFAKATQDAGGARKTPDGVFYYGERQDRPLPSGHVAGSRRTSGTAGRRRPRPRFRRSIRSCRSIADKKKIEDGHVFDPRRSKQPGRGRAATVPGDPFARGAEDISRRAAADSSWQTRSPSPDNPLTARVFVNRVWMHHFGRGIVATPSNFGQLGERPTHPELLDYLASEFVENGWSIKKLHRQIMLSDTYALERAGDGAEQDQGCGECAALAREPAAGWMWSRCAIRCCTSRESSTATPAEGQGCSI